MALAFLIHPSSFLYARACPCARQRRHRPRAGCGEIRRRRSRHAGPHSGGMSPDLALPNLCSLGLGAILASPVGETPSSWRRRPPARQSLALPMNSTPVTAGCANAPRARTPRPGTGKSPASFWRSRSQPSSASRRDSLGDRARGRRAFYRQLCSQWHNDSGGARRRTSANREPILYTSADSVLQIAAHEEIVPLDRLDEICQRARRQPIATASVA